MLELKSYGVATLSVEEEMSFAGGCDKALCSFLDDVAYGAAWLVRETGDFLRGVWDGLSGK